MRKFFALICVFAALIAVSCEKETLLNVSEHTISFDKNGGSESLSITANKPWSVTFDQNWCTASVRSGGASESPFSIAISCEKNASYDERECKMHVSCDELDYVVSITQSGADGLIIDNNRYDISRFAQTINVPYRYSGDFDVVIPDDCKDWISVVKTKGISMGYCVLEVTENDTYEVRECPVVFRQVGGDINQTVYVRQSTTDAIIIDDLFTVSSDAQMLDIEVKFNVDYDVYVFDDDVDWIRVVDTKAMNSQIHTFEILENKTYEPREGRIAFEHKGGGIRKIAVVRQSEANVIIVEGPRTEPFYVHDFSIDVNSTTGYEVIVGEDCEDWLHVVSTKSLKHSSVSFVIDENVGDERVGHIYLENSNRTETIEVTQKGSRVIREALAALYDATDGDNWTNNTNWCTDKPLAEWYGIFHSNYWGINLQENNLTGTIPPEISELKTWESFESFTLNANNLSGDISDILRYFGEIPGFRNLNIGHNHITGEIGSGLAALPDLVELYLSCNELSGSLPDISGNKKLEMLSLECNKFTGTIPVHYGAHPIDMFLQVNYNYMSGVIPQEVVNNPSFFHWMYMPQYDGNILTADVYHSEDYSEDGKVTQLQKASAGKGIDVVLMGAGFVDRDIASGVYEDTMRKVMDAFFSYEPYNKLRDYFNVYMVNIVSKSNDLNDVTASPFQVILSTDYTFDGAFTADLSPCQGYVYKAVGKERLTDAIGLVVCHNFTGSGFAVLPTDEMVEVNGEMVYPCNSCIFFDDGDELSMNYIVSHEAGGHAFAEFSDEYCRPGDTAEASYGAFDVIHSIGHFLNVTTESDPDKVPWAHFINDLRYSGEDIGVYEGTYYFPKSSYRASRLSVMNDYVAPFNAYQRELIYKRVHALADGPDWQYDYEEFVKFDLGL